jgi:hypothetical protein
MPSTTTSTKFPISATKAHSIGIDCANEWLNRDAESYTKRTNKVRPPASPDAWRARSLANIVQDTHDQDNFLQVMEAWGKGYDTTLTNARQSAPKSIHERFSWMHTSLNDYSGEFMETTYNVCRGIKLCLELNHISNLDRKMAEDADPGQEIVPTLSENDAETLLLFATASAGLLAQNTEDRMSRMTERAMQENRQ